MTHLKNNGIALAVHALFVVVFVLLSFSDVRLEGMTKSIVDIAIYLFCGLAYIAWGFFLLRPVKKNSFLSVISVILAVIIAYICVTIHYTWDSGLGGMLFATNPALGSILSVFSFLPDRIFSGIAFILLFLSPLFPSLLIYFGMVLRRFLKKIRLKKSKCSTQTV